MTADDVLLAVFWALTAFWVFAWLTIIVAATVITRRHRGGYDTDCPDCVNEWGNGDSGEPGP